MVYLEQDFMYLSDTGIIFNFYFPEKCRFTIFITVFDRLFAKKIRLIYYYGHREGKKSYLKYEEVYLEKLVL